jgi:hypothetical protein
MAMELQPQMVFRACVEDLCMAVGLSVAQANFSR